MTFSIERGEIIFISLLHARGVNRVSWIKFGQGVEEKKDKLLYM